MVRNKPLASLLVGTLACCGVVKALRGHSFTPVGYVAGGNFVSADLNWRAPHGAKG